MERVRYYILNYVKEGGEVNSHKLDLTELCMDQLLSTSAISDSLKKSLNEIAQDYNINCKHQRPTEATAALARHNGNTDIGQDTFQVNELHIARIHMEMRLERLMAETFKEYRN